MSTSTPSSELPFRIAVSATGHGLVEVAGVDLSNSVAALAFDAKPNSISRLTLELRGDTELDGHAQVTVVMRPGPDIDGLLAKIDPEELESEALRRLEGFDGRPVAAVMLDVLREWLADGS